MASASRRIDDRPASPHLRSLALAAALLVLAGCPTRDKYGALPTVRLTSPSIFTTYTNATVHLTAAIDPPLDLPIVLWLDGTIPLTTLASPSDTFDWDTRGVSEGPHTIVAEVVFSRDSARSAAKTILVDRTPPRVIVRTPIAGATDVGLRAPIQVQFSEPIVLPSPVSTAFTISIASVSLPSRVALAVDGTAASIWIEDPIAVSFPATVTGTIAPTIRDRAGNDLTASGGDWTWTAPDVVALPAVTVEPNLPPAARLPALAIGSDLRPVIANAASVVSGGDLDWRIQVSRYEGARWRALGSPSADADSASRGVGLAVRGEHPLVAWRASGPDPGEVDVASWTVTGWNAFPGLVPAPGDAYSIVTPIVRVAPDQPPVVLWGTCDRTFIARRTWSGWNEGFGPLPITTLPAFDGDRFDMILDDAGDPIVSWINPTSVGHVSMWRRGVWVNAPDVLGMDDPFMALDGARRPMVAVTNGAGGVLVQHLVDGDDWQLLPVARLPPHAKHLKIGAGATGLPVIAYFDAQTSSIGLARWNGQQWDTRAFAFAPNAVDQVPQLVVDRDGTAWLGWRDDTDQFHVWMSNY
jgi:hypothetical protein